MANGHVKYIPGREKIEAMLPVARRTKGDEYFMTAGLQTAAKIDKVSFSAAIVPCGRNVQYPHD